MKASLRHKMVSVRWLTLVLGACSAALTSPGCSTTSTLAPPSAPKEVALPSYAYLAHPGGYTSNDLRLLFTDKAAPAPEALSKCEADVQTLLSRVKSYEERSIGMRELVSKNPATYHWCFYSRILNLEDSLQQDQYVDEKQKHVVKAYEYLVPVARAFMQEFQDSRYMRWAIRDYRRLADLYFYRKLEMSPQMSSEFVDVEVPFQQNAAETYSESRRGTVLEKYKIGPSISDAPALPAPPAPPALTQMPSALPAPSDPAAEGATADTLQYAQELANERKQSEAQNRFPAAESLAAPASAPLNAPATAPVTPATAPATTDSPLVK